MLDRAGSLQRRYAALSGLAAEHMGRTASWRFHDLGRRIERAIVVTRLVRTFGLAGATSDDLSTLLDLADSQISYRQRYLTGIARVPVVDLVALDPGNPRSLAYQVDCIAAHLDHLPVLHDDGLPEDQQAEALALKALLAATNAASLDARAFDRGRAATGPPVRSDRAALFPARRGTVARRRPYARVIYDIKHVTRFDYGQPVAFARCNLRLKPIHWSGQHVEQYALAVNPAGETRPALAEAGLANVTRLVVRERVRTLTIESASRVVVDRLVPVPDASDPTLAEVAALARADRDLGPAGPTAYLFPSPLIPLDADIAAWCARGT